jgi:transcriptional regulator of acetoin/glycerol metabolism
MRGKTTEAALGTPLPGVLGTPAVLKLTWFFPQRGPLFVELGDRGGPEETLIGRDPLGAIRLEGSDVSRRHASLRKKNGVRPGTEIVDLGSRNGIYINGLQVTSAELIAGDVLRIGGWVGLVSEVEGEFLEVAPGLLGGAVLQAALAPLQRAASSDLPVVLEGETGTGKEVVTRSVHAWSGRSGPLVAVNCAALPEALAEGELFGYRRGAFTGADRSSPGFFRRADKGTLLLDEVTELPLGLQSKLLRVLEEREVQPLGEDRSIPVDVRVIVAGQRSLLEAARQGQFRADLLARLDGVTVRLPPLRARREDVFPLFSHFLGALGQGRTPSLEGALVERLLVHDWPFNIRELGLVVRRLVVLHGHESTLRAAHLPERIGDLAATAVPSERLSAGSSARSSQSSSPPCEPVEFPALVAALRASAGNVARAAAMLGITRQRAYRLMEGKSVDLEALRDRERGGR